MEAPPHQLDGDGLIRKYGPMSPTSNANQTVVNRPTDSHPTDSGMDKGRLEAIDDFIKVNYLDTGKFPGFSLSIFRNGNIVHRSDQGYTPDALFRIYSMTKPITSIALLGLLERGAFQLDDPVSALIPAFSDQRVFEDGTPTTYTTAYPDREMTVRDLLTHTSGLTYSWMHRHPVDAIYRQSEASAPAGETLENMVNRVGSLPLLCSPGAQWNYSVSTDVCGRLIEVMSGTSLDQYLRDEILNPLGMYDTGFSTSADNTDRLTECYALASVAPFGVPAGAPSSDLVNSETVLVDDGRETSRYRKQPSFLSGGGGLLSTMNDYGRFAQMLLNGGELDGNRVIGRKTLQYATLNHLPTSDDLTSMGQSVFSETSYDGIGFGLGFAVNLDPARSQVMSSAGEFSWGGAASTTFWVDPAENLAVIGMTQLLPSSAYPIRSQLRNLVYGALT